MDSYLAVVSHVKVLWTILLWQCEILSVSISIRAHTLALAWLPSLMNLTTLVHYLHIAIVIREAKADEQGGEREKAEEELEQLLKLLGSESKAINTHSLASSSTASEASLKNPIKWQ